MIREEIKLPDGVLNRIPLVVEEVSNQPDVQALYAFGTIATGELQPLSDLDFGILLSEHLDKIQRLKTHLDLIALFNRVFSTDEVDLVLMNDAPPRFAFNIIKDGKLLFQRDKKALVNFRERVVMSHLDFIPVKKEFDAIFLKGIGYDG